MAVIALSMGDLAARTSTRGGSLLKLDWRGVPLLRPASDEAAAIDSACFPLVPFANRIRGNSFTFEGENYALRPNTDWDKHYLHGEGWRSEWRVTDSSHTDVTMAHSYDGDAAPYAYEARQTIALGDGVATIALSVTNRGPRAMPFGIGWHPHFPMTPGTRLTTRTGRMWTEDADWLPVAPGPVPGDLDFTAPASLPHRWVNNGFEDWSGRARIDWPERGAALRIEADPVFNAMFLFVSDTGFDPDYARDFFALEPMSHLADGHNMADLGGLTVLAPGETLSGAMRLIPEAA